MGKFGLVDAVSQSNFVWVRIKSKETHLRGRNENKLTLNSY